MKEAHQTTFGTRGAVSKCRLATLRQFVLMGALITIAASAVSCERDTTLTIQGGNPPQFVMKGSGRLTALRVRGPEKQRNAEGEAAFLYWVIEMKVEGTDRNVREVSPIVYGNVSEGYKQVYPEKGGPPQLVEGERYYVQVIAMNANGAGKYFTIRDGKVEVSDY